MLSTILDFLFGVLCYSPVRSVHSSDTSTMDDPFVACPYNFAHRVPRSRIQAHIVKCQPNYPELNICPYNATHRVSKLEMRTHVLNCPSKSAIFPQDKPPRLTGSLTTPKPILQKDYLPETDPNHEMWDD
ncbi:unnamed protein product [Parnassius apollo]|uniref:(apollo) hypothetical protein n=1 Tax=Parnassius apollo TaxID=110799 RepID=A0A8S3XQL3_PARAO|nr:unnamed protein product [Parnassius apollo]